MLAALARIFFGLFVACLVAGLVQTLFVVTPLDLLGAGSDALPASLANAGFLSLLTATHTAMFVAPFGLIAAALGEWQHVRQMLYYALIGIVIAMAGLFALYMSEANDLTIANPYALVAYFMTGLISGFTYWLVAGRFAGGHRPRPTFSSEQSA